MQEFLNSTLELIGLPVGQAPNAMVALILAAAGTLAAAVYKMAGDWIHDAVSQLITENWIALCVFFLWAIFSAWMLTTSRSYIPALVSGSVLLAYVVASKKAPQLLQRKILKSRLTVDRLMLLLAVALFPISWKTVRVITDYSFESLEQEGAISLLLPLQTDAEVTDDQTQEPLDALYAFLHDALRKPMGAASHVALVPDEISDSRFKAFCDKLKDEILGGSDFADFVIGYSRDSARPIKFVFNSKVIELPDNMSRLQIYPELLDITNAKLALDPSPPITVDGALHANSKLERQRMGMLTAFGLLTYLGEATKSNPSAQQEFAQIWSKFGDRSVAFATSFIREHRGGLDKHLAQAASELQDVLDKNSACISRDCLSSLYAPLAWAAKQSDDKGAMGIESQIERFKSIASGH